MGALDSDLQFVRDGINLRILARRQRQIIWLIGAALIVLVAQFPLLGFIRVFHLPPLLIWIMYSLFWGLQLMVIVGTFLLVRTLGMRWYFLPIIAVIMLMPLINLIFLVMENGAATSMLKKAGLDVGFWGVADEIVVRRLSAEVCSQCGYNLTGNVSGICPECGTMIRGLEPSHPL